MKRSFALFSVSFSILFAACSLAAVLFGLGSLSVLFFDFAFCLFAFLVLILCAPVLLGNKIGAWIEKRCDGLLNLLQRTVLWFQERHHFQRAIFAGLFLFLCIISFKIFDKVHVQRSVYRWLAETKEGGWILQIPFDPEDEKKLRERPFWSRPPLSYTDRLMNNHLKNVEKGYVLSTIYPLFYHLSKDYLEQLHFMRVSYIVLDLRNPKTAILDPDGLPPTASFKNALVYKVPERLSLITVLYSPDFYQKTLGNFTPHTRWMIFDEGNIYLHNRLPEDVVAHASLSLSCATPSQVKIFLNGMDSPLWEKEVSLEGVDISLKNLVLKQGKNILKLKLDVKENHKSLSIISKFHQGGMTVGVKSLEVSCSGVSPQETALDIGKIFTSHPSYEKWLGSLPEEKKVLEYPMMHRDWKMPVNYSIISREHGVRNVNYKFDRYVPDFAANTFKNKPYPGLSWWAEFLKIDYIVVHRDLFEWPPIVNENYGLIEEAKFGNSIVYRPNPNRIFLEAENAISQGGRNTPDPDAVGGNMARKISNVITKKHNPFLVYGPYTPLAPGHYRATYRMKVEKLGARPVAGIDVYADVGRQGLATREIHADEFGKPQRYRDFILEFDVNEVTILEFRIRHKGKNNTLWADYILVEKLERNNSR